jgi:hypothetical protein
VSFKTYSSFGEKKTLKGPSKENPEKAPKRKQTEKETKRKRLKDRGALNHILCVQYRARKDR